MLFPGIRQIGKKLDLYNSGGSVFGKYRGFLIYAFDGNNKKTLIIKMERSIHEEDLSQLKNKYKVKDFSFDTDESALRVEFSEILKPYSHKKIINLIDEIVDLCNEKGIGAVTNCDFCDSEDIDYCKYDTTPMCLCPSCYTDKVEELNSSLDVFKTLDNNYLKGLFGAFIFSLPGVLIQGILFIYLTRLGAISSLIYCVLALSGFKKFKGKPTPLSALLVILLSIFMTAIGTFLSYSGFLYYKAQDLSRVIELLLIEEIQLELKSNILMQTVISSIYLVFEFISLRKNWSFKSIEKAQKVYENK